MPLTPEEIFTPNAFPRHTYVVRAEDGKEEVLATALRTPGQLVSISGPSKSGKTVLVEKVAGIAKIVVVTGSEVAGPNELWDEVLDKLGEPDEVERSEHWDVSGTIGAEVDGKVGIPYIAEGGAKVTGSGTVGGGRGGTARSARQGLAQAVDTMVKQDRVLMLDDFHYMGTEAQAKVARSVKEAARLGLRVCFVSVPHRSDDIVRSNRELRGRVMHIDLDYWSPEDLRQIPAVGFELLNSWIDDDSVERLVSEAAGSPQLMQLFCLHLCFELGIEGPAAENDGILVSQTDLDKVFRRACGTVDFRTVLRSLDDGPKTRGKERKSYEFKDGSKGDVYTAILKGLALQPPSLTISDKELLSRVAEVCAHDAPGGDSISKSMGHMHKILGDDHPAEHIWDWNQRRLHIEDPYFLFYLRWSAHMGSPRTDLTYG